MYCITDTHRSQWPLFIIIIIIVPAVKMNAQGQRWWILNGTGGRGLVWMDDMRTSGTKYIILIVIIISGIIIIIVISISNFSRVSRRKTVVQLKIQHGSYLFKGHMPNSEKNSCLKYLHSSGFFLKISFLSQQPLAPPAGFTPPHKSSNFAEYIALKRFRQKTPVLFCVLRNQPLSYFISI